MARTGAQAHHDDLLRDVLAEIRRLRKAGQAIYRPMTGHVPAAPGASAKPVPKSGTRRTRQPRSLGAPTAVALGLVLIVAVGLLATHYLTKEIRGQRVRRTLHQAEIDLDILRTNLKNAQGCHRQKDYVKALRKYQEVLRDARTLIGRVTDETYALSAGPYKAGADALTADATKILRVAQGAVAAPEIRYGGKGLVFDDGAWVTEAEKKERLEKRMKAEGRVLYEGQWRTPAEIAELRGEVYFEGRYISKEEYTKIMAAKGRPKPTPRPKPKPPVRPRPTSKTPRKFEAAAPRWVLDDFETGHNWRSVTWPNANQCSLTVLEGSNTRRLRMRLAGGDHDKSALMRQLRLDISSRSRLVMDVENDCGENVPIAIAVQTNTYFESRPHMLRPGLNRGVAFNLKTGDFKTEATSWTHRTKITRPRTAMWLYVLVYHKRPGALIFDNVVAQGGT